METKGSHAWPEVSTKSMARAPQKGTLQEIGLGQMKPDSCLFSTADRLTHIVVYVDDLFIAGLNKVTVTSSQKSDRGFSSKKLDGFNQEPLFTT